MAKEASSKKSSTKQKKGVLLPSAVKAKPPREPEPLVSEDEDNSESGAVQEEKVEEDHLHGLSTDEDSSDADSDMDDEPVGLDVSRLPTIARDDATVKRKLEKAKREPTADRGVLYLGRIPHGFYEDQMKAYFSQFGTVTRLRLSRNKKTGKSKHYGFIEFDSSSVAKIVAEAMNNYLMNGHILQCKLIPKEEVHAELWIGANRKWRAVPPDQLTRARHNKKRDEESRNNASRRLIKRQNQRKRKLNDLGIKYDFDTVSYKKPKAANEAS